MSEYFPKYYRVIDLDRLDSIRAWAMQLAHRSQLVEEISGDQHSYMVIVQDALGLSPMSRVFESEFGSGVLCWEPGE